MKKLTKREKVEKLLIKWGGNLEETKILMDKNYEYAATTYSTNTKIAECITTIY